VPRLASGDAGKRALRLRLDLDADTWRELEAEARRQDGSVDALVRHPIFYLLADLDSGRAARRILEED